MLVFRTLIYNKGYDMKTIEEINAKIQSGKAVILTAEEMTALAKDVGVKKASEQVDVVTTGTFSPMCSSGLFFNIGQPEPPMIKASTITLNNVSAYGGIAAADGYIGVTEVALDDPLNKVYPGKFLYGGGHVIEDLVAGKKVKLLAEGYGTDCYPNRKIEREITLNDLPFAQMLNPRNCYQNYNVAVNLGAKTVHTYMGSIRPNLSHANYATAGNLSPLFNDPYLRTIGLGTKIFMGGGLGYVIGTGTQHVAEPKRNEQGIPLTPSGTLMLKGDLKGMKQKYVRGLSYYGYGCTLALGVGIPIPILDEEMAYYTSISNDNILLPVKDYDTDYPNGIPRILDHVSYTQLRTGSFELMGKKVKTSPLTSYTISQEIAVELKRWIVEEKFEITAPIK